MLRLILFRHAKAERGHGSMRDHDRVLEPRGRDDAAKVGAYLAHHALVPDLAIVSDAARTRETWSIAASAIGKAVTRREEPRLYAAAPDDILDVVRETAADIRTLIVVGHNPGMHDVATSLIAAGDVLHRETINEGFPTSALAAIDFAVRDWNKVHWHGGRLERFVVPRMLTATTE